MIFSRKTPSKNTFFIGLSIVFFFLGIGILFTRGYIGSYKGLKISKEVYSAPDGYRMYRSDNPFAFYSGYAEVTSAGDMFALSSSFIIRPDLSITFLSNKLPPEHEAVFRKLHRQSKKYGRCVLKF